MLANPGKDPEAIVAENPDYQPLSDQGEIEKIIDQVLADHPETIIEYKAGKDRAFTFFVGQVMKLTRGKASPQIVNQILKEKLQ